MKSIARDGLACSSEKKCDVPSSFRPGALRRRSAFASRTRCLTSNSRPRPESPQRLSVGVMARQMVLSVRLSSATTRLVSSGSRPRSRHSTEAKKDFRSIAI